MNPKLIWPVTALGVAVVAGIVILGLAGKDVGALVGFAGAVMAGLIYGKIDQVKDLANGTTNKMLEALLHRQQTPATTDTQPQPGSSNPWTPNTGQ